MLPGVLRSLTLGLNIVNKNYHLIFSSDLLLTIICQTFNNTRGEYCSTVGQISWQINYIDIFRNFLKTLFWCRNQNQNHLRAGLRPNGPLCMQWRVLIFIISLG